MQVDVDDAYVEIEAMKLDGLRTSLIVDPPDGMLPPLLPAAQERASARPSAIVRRSRSPGSGGTDDASYGNFGARRVDGLAANGAQPGHRVVLSDRAGRDAHAMISSNGSDDARIIRMNRCARAADNPEVARRFDRLLGRVHARRRHDELSTRHPQSWFRANGCTSSSDSHESIRRSCNIG